MVYHCLMQPSQKETIAVLYGGVSSEREVSLRSGKCIGAALEQAGYTVRMLDTGPMPEAELLEKLRDCAVVFPVLHGADGEDGSVQSWLEGHGFKYIGADAATSALCLDKIRYKEAVLQYGIRLPEGKLVDFETFKQSPLINRPYVLKPFDGGSSVDTFIARDPQTVDTQAVRAAFEKYHQMLVEELIEGVEITVGVLDDKLLHDGKIDSTALPVIEIIPPADGEFDYENKYNGKSQELCPPQHVEAEVQKQAQETARHIHRALKVRDISRTDMIVHTGDNTLYVLETNTMPGMTDQSLYPKAAAVAGYSMAQLVDKLVQNALRR